MLQENVLVHMVRLIKPWTPDDSTAGGNEWPLKAPYDDVRLHALMLTSESGA